jgi:transcriptional regulator of acetoin/glycerol metabolism
MVVTQTKILNRQDFLLNQVETNVPVSSTLSLEEVEKSHILRMLEKNNWNISNTAKMLGIDRVTIYKKLQKYGIKRPENA